MLLFGDEPLSYLDLNWEEPLSGIYLREESTLDFLGETRLYALGEEPLFGLSCGKPVIYLGENRMQE